MKIERWNLEILVNEQPLREYVIPDSILGDSASNVLKSYVIEGTRKKFCDSATFVAVPAPGTYYSIKISPSSSEIAAKVYVDGIDDGSLARSNLSSCTIMKGFRNRNSNTIHYFIFDKTEWVDTNISQRTEFGGFGAVSVYFYKIRSMRTSYSHNSNKEFEKVKVPENKKCFDVALTTKFSEGAKYYASNRREKVETDDEPLAVLHINYRSTDWFFLKEIKIQENSMIDNTSTSNEMENIATTVDIKDEVIKAEPEISKEIITVSNDNKRKTSITHVRKKKQKYQEIVVILDSDDDKVIELE
ncbi:hypothetical protein C1645_733014 [Glomus cerebriforme]|uniref:Uncharacterized protein n=1 Tax=Glomus cerebriforme TaxID=658196 RepID=A0A397TIJ6_9GLOM|nr:hypothetical protein C1645_733014 [Glomus cerebriforme]